MGEPASEQAGVEAFIERWTSRSGGAERANYALFLVELCDLVGVGRPDPAGEETVRNDHVFERAVRFRHDDGTASPGRIDLYKKGCFVLEAKQSKKREKGGEVYEQLAFALTSGRGGAAVMERSRVRIPEAVGRVGRADSLTARPRRPVPSASPCSPVCRVAEMCQGRNGGHPWRSVSFFRQFPTSSELTGINSSTT